MRFLALPASRGGIALPGISSLSFTNDAKKGIANAGLYNGTLPIDTKTWTELYDLIKPTCNPQEQCNNNLLQNTSNKSESSDKIYGM